MTFEIGIPKYRGDSCERGRCSREDQDEPSLTKYGYLYFCDNPSCFEKWRRQIRQQTSLEDYLYKKFVASRKYFIPFCPYCLTRTVSIWSKHGGYCKHCFRKRRPHLKNIEDQLELIPLIVDIKTFEFVLQDHCIYQNYYVDLNNIITVLQKRTHDNLTPYMKRELVEVLMDKILELDDDANGNTIDFKLLPTIFHVFVWSKPITAYFDNK